MSRIGALLDRHTKIKLGLAVFVSILLAALDMLAIILMLPLVQLATGGEPSNFVEHLLSSLFGNPSTKVLVICVAVLTVCLFIAKDIGSMMFSWWQAGFNARNRVRTSTQIMRHYLTTPYTVISRRSSAELLRTMNNSVDQVYGKVVNSILAMTIQGFTMVGIAVALLIAAPLPTLALILYLGAGSMLYLRVMKPKAVRAGRDAARAQKAGYRAAFAAIGGLKETQVRGSQAVFARRFEEASKRSIHPGQVGSFLGAAPKFFLEMLFIVAVGVLLVVTMLVRTDEASDGTVVALLATFVAAGFRALPSATGFVACMSVLRSGFPHLELVEAEFKQMDDPFVELPDHKARRLPFKNEIVIDDVHFTYPGASRPALDGVSARLPYGHSLALAGSSGAGKTTLVDTLLGLHNPAVGAITVDGRDITSNSRAWQANIGYVPQEVFILDATLAENIAFDETHDQVDPNRLAKAIAHAQLEDVVANLPDGVDTYIGERGSRLSGGQRQRVGIARALYRQPTMLVLDEATSALDNETEHRITEAIEGLLGTVTVVIVAHRLSTARHASQLAFMSDGKIVTTGTFEEVRDSNGEFARLVELGALT